MDGRAEFAYLANVASKYGMLYLAQDFEQFIAAIDGATLAELAAAYQEIDRRQDSYRLSRWLQHIFEERKPDFREKRFAQQLGQLFVLFEQLAEREISPFDSRQVAYIEPFQKPDWDNVPDELRYLIEPAQKYGGSLSEVEILKTLESGNDADMELLTAVAEKVRLNGHYQLLLDWLKQFPSDKHEEAKILYSLFGVMDHAGLDFE